MTTKQTAETGQVFVNDDNFNFFWGGGGGPGFNSSIKAHAMAEKRIFLNKGIVHENKSSINRA
jgi:hypothetical protein